jgi:hypothetical protein
MPTTENTTTDRSAQQEAHKRSLFISREEVARSLGIGRTTVWKLTKAAANGRGTPSPSTSAPVAPGGTAPRLKHGRPRLAASPRPRGPHNAQHFSHPCRSLAFAGVHRA